MPNSFSIARSRCSVVSDPDLRAEIQSHTGSDQATTSILRSIDRFGGDDSIQRYEMTPKARGNARPTSRTIAWSVRAVRAEATQS